jgi:hypothetical protein
MKSLDSLLERCQQTVSEAPTPSSLMLMRETRESRPRVALVAITVLAVGLMVGGPVVPAGTAGGTAWSLQHQIAEIQGQR